MPDAELVLEELVQMSRRLGAPAADCVILGEGTTSALIDEESFWVKASGAELPGITAEGFARVRFAPLLRLFDSPDVSDDTVQRVFAEASLGREGQRASTEAVMHALLLRLDGVRFAAHTHPTVLAAVLCSRRVDEALGGRLFPDEVVCCGFAPAWVPYADPGVPLARRVAASVDEYSLNYGRWPQTIWLQNHGLVALGASAREAENVTAMSIKAARVLLGTYLMGGPHFLPQANVQRIHTRPDEVHRRHQLGYGNP